MLGWFFAVYRWDEKTPLKQVGAAGEEKVVSWETSLGGIDWLDRLAKAGRVTFHGGNGYPYFYSGTVRELLPHLTPRPPKHDGPMVIGDDYAVPGDWIGPIRFNEGEVAKCEPDGKLLILVFDQS